MENKADIINRTQREEKINSIDESKPCMTPDNFDIIEKRLKDLELSREVESSENFKKISKLEKIVEDIKKEKSISPSKKIVKTEFKRKDKIRHRSTSVKSINKHTKSAILKPKPKKLCVYIKDLEEEAEKWKKKAKLLAKKNYSEIREMKKELIGMKSLIEIERNEFREYCYAILHKSNKMQ